MPIREAGLRYTVLGNVGSPTGLPFSACCNGEESKLPPSLTGKQDFSACVGLDEGSSRTTSLQRGQSRNTRFSKLCAYCQHLFDRVASIKEEGEAYGANLLLGQPGEVHRHVETEPELRASSVQGCGLCSQLSRAEWPEKDKNDYGSLARQNWPSAGFVWLHFNLEQLDGIGGWQIQLVVRHQDQFYNFYPLVYIANFPGEGEF